MPEPVASVIGLGIGEQHILAYQEAGIRVNCVCDLDLGRAKAIGERYQVAYTNSWEQAIEFGQIVSICSYDQFHLNHAMMALSAGRAVLVEKPLCLTRPGLQILSSLSASRNAYLGCNLPLRYHPEFLELRNKLPTEITHIEADYNWGRNKKLLGWRKDCEGYNIVLGAGIHMVDLVHWLTRDHIVWCQAVGTQTTAGFNSWDHVAIIFRLSSGITGRMNINCAYDGVHEHRLAIWHEGGRVEVINTGPTNKKLGVKDFVSAVTSGGIPSPSKFEIFDDTEVCFAVLDSLAEGRPVGVSYQ